MSHIFDPDSCPCQGCAMRRALERASRTIAELERSLLEREQMVRSIKRAFEGALAVGPDAVVTVAKALKDFAPEYGAPITPRLIAAGSREPCRGLVPSVDGNFRRCTRLEYHEGACQ